MCSGAGPRERIKYNGVKVSCNFKYLLNEAGWLWVIEGATLGQYLLEFRLRISTASNVCIVKDGLWRPPLCRIRVDSVIGCPARTSRLPFDSIAFPRNLLSAPTPSAILPALQLRKYFSPVGCFQWEIQVWTSLSRFAFAPH